MSLTCEVCGETYPNEHKVGCREFLLKENKRLKAICEKMAEALKDMSIFHEYRSDDEWFENIEKKYGFTGWTCCSQLEHIAKEALSLYEAEMKK